MIIYIYIVGNASYLIRMGQTGGFGYAPNARWPNAFMATAFDLANPPNTKCVSGCIRTYHNAFLFLYFFDSICLNISVIIAN